MHQTIILNLIIILAILVILMFGFLIVAAISVRRKAAKELSDDSSAYPKVTGEPRWSGIIPHVDDYTEPRYVYENLKESTDYLPENGRIIGYRIAPNLVIHSTIILINPTGLSAYKNRLGGGSLLNGDDAIVFMENWDKVSALREKIGLTPLKDNPFWFSYNELPCAGYKCGEYRDLIGFPDCYCLLVLKR